MGEAHIPGICNDLTGGESRIYLAYAYASSPPPRVFFPSPLGAETSQCNYTSLSLLHSFLPSFLYLRAPRFRSIGLPSTVQQSTMASTAMDPETGVGTGVGSGVADPSVDANRRKSRRKSTVAHIPQEVVDQTQLSDADRRLAEMGYVQVLPPLPPSLIYCPNNTEHITPTNINGTARLTLQIEYH